MGELMASTLLPVVAQRAAFRWQRIFQSSRLVEQTHYETVSINPVPSIESIGRGLTFVQIGSPSSLRETTLSSLSGHGPYINGNASTLGHPEIRPHLGRG